MLVEAELGKGVIASPLSKYATFNTRICRPVGLTAEDRSKVVKYVIERIGYDYDLKNIIDLMRYFLPQPPVPASWRRRMIALGSGEPTRRDLLKLDRAGLRIGGISDPAGRRPGRRRKPPRDHAYPPSLALRPARFRRVAFLCYRQADDRDRIRLQADEMGKGRLMKHRHTICRHSGMRHKRVYTRLRRAMAQTRNSYSAAVVSPGSGLRPAPE